MQHTFLHYLQSIILTVLSLLKTSFQHWIIASLPVAWQNLSSSTKDQLVPHWERGVLHCTTGQVPILDSS